MDIITLLCPWCAFLSTAIIHLIGKQKKRTDEERLSRVTHPKQTVFTAADNRKLAPKRGSCRGRGWGWGGVIATT